MYKTIINYTKNIFIDILFYESSPIIFLKNYFIVKLLILLYITILLFGSFGYTGETHIILFLRIKIIKKNKKKGKNDPGFFYLFDLNPETE